MLCVVAVFAVAAVAYAGWTDHEEVNIVGDEDDGRAWGSLYGARHGSGDQYISCSLRSSGLEYDNPMDLWGYCYARDANGEEVSCNTYSPHHVQVIGSISSASHIRFRYETFWLFVSEVTRCTRIEVENGSQYIE